MAAKALQIEKPKRAWVHINLPALDMRGVLAFLSTVLFAATLLAPLFANWLGKGIVVDPDLKGAIILQWGGVMSWYFGSSKSAATKDDTISTQAKTIAANPPTGSQ